MEKGVVRYKDFVCIISLCVYHAKHYVWLRLFHKFINKDHHNSFVLYFRDYMYFSVHVISVSGSENCGMQSLKASAEPNLTNKILYLLLDTLVLHIHVFP